MTERQFPMALPLDSDGFLRRECPTCEREFKWLPTPDGEQGAPVPDGGLFCPYCAVQAAPDAWFTKAQIERAKGIAYDEVVGPELEKFKKTVEGLNQTGGLIDIRADVTIEGPRPATELKEADDMRRVDFPCHPAEPVKVLDDWAGEVHCHVCGTARASSAPA